MNDWHSYAHGAQGPTRAWLAILGVAFAWAWTAGTRALGWTPPWWLDTPAVFGFYGLLYLLFDRVLWRLPLLMPLHGIPDLNGKYRVMVRTSADGHVSNHPASASITQSWSRVVVRMDFEGSCSRSKAAWLYIAPGAGTTLAYVYDNTPKGAAPSALNQHEGTAVVTFEPNGGLGTGSYYTGRGRTTFGELTFAPEV